MKPLLSAVVFLVFGLMSIADADSDANEGVVLYTTEFTHGLADFVIEQEQPAVVSAEKGRLDIDAPAGVTVWLNKKLTGPLSIEFDAVAIQQGGPNDRVSDLNCFWMADNAGRTGDLFKTPRTGTFADYDTLKCYYVGYGGNANSTTRFRRYIGEKSNRPLRPGDEYTDARHLLKPNTSVHIRLIADGHRIEYWRDGEKLFAMDDARPYREGWFGFRTVKSHLELRNLVIRQLPERGQRSTTQSAIQNGR